MTDPVYNIIQLLRSKTGEAHPKVFINIIGLSQLEAGIEYTHNGFVILHFDGDELVYVPCDKIISIESVWYNSDTKKGTE